MTRTLTVTPEPRHAGRPLTWTLRDSAFAGGRRIEGCTYQQVYDACRVVRDAGGIVRREELDA